MKSSVKQYVADELLPKLFGPSRHYIDLESIQRTLEREAIHYEPTTIKRYLQEWQNEGRVFDAGRGWYSNLPNSFTPDREILAIRFLRDTVPLKFPLLDFTLWSTRELSPYFHHLPTRHATFLMVDRDMIEPVAEALLEAGSRVVVHPLGDSAKAFALKGEDTVIVRPRLSADHAEVRSPIEQILVDLYYENGKLRLYEGEEILHIVRNVSAAFRVNIPALKRYAERRKLDPTALLAAIV